MLFDELNRQTIAKVQKTGLPYFFISEKEQVGTTFGERYTNAIQFVYDQGFESIITIGNDTPNIQTSQLLATAKYLETEKIVVGPSKDGGFYLLGMHKSQFNPTAFLALPWQTGALFKSTVRLFKLKATVFTLRVLQDIDTLVDVKQLKDLFYVSKQVKQLLLQINGVALSAVPLVTLPRERNLIKDHFNKGSPIAA